MSETLYNISSALLQVIEQSIIFDEETGEVYFDESDTDALTVQLVDKLEAVQVVSSQKRDRAAYLKAEAKRLTNAAKALEKTADSLDSYAVKCVEPFGKLETDHYTIGTRKTDAVQVLDEEAVPSEYLTRKETVSVNKQAVKAALKAGESVPGCALVKNVHLTVR